MSLGGSGENLRNEGEGSLFSAGGKAHFSEFNNTTCTFLKLYQFRI